MNNQIIKILLLATLFAFTYADDDQAFITECLDAHNVYRTDLGIDELTWSEDLAAQAQDWADQMASMKSMKHSSRDDEGENIARGKASTHPPKRFIDKWADEKQYFEKGEFPDVSSTGSWKDVGHYTQMIWSTTQQVGCANSVNSGQAYFVCQYLPRGNKHGDPVYCKNRVDITMSIS